MGDDALLIILLVLLVALCIFLYRSGGLGKIVDSLCDNFSIKRSDKAPKKNGKKVAFNDIVQRRDIINPDTSHEHIVDSTRGLKPKASG